MNRERLLFVGVLAIIGLWFFVLREAADPVTSAKPRNVKITVLGVTAIDLPDIVFRMPEVHGAFTKVTNERAHDRPPLAAVVARDLPNIWIPTSRSVRLSLLGRLRRATVAPVVGGAEGEATIELPATEADAAANNAGGEEIARRDGWTALGNPGGGRIVRLTYKRNKIRDPQQVPAPGALPNNDFYRLLALLEVDPVKAQQEGLTQIEVILKIGGSSKVTYSFPKDIQNVEAALEGTEAAYLEGLKGYMRLPAKSAQARVTLGQRLLAAGEKAGNMDPRVRWAMIILEEARKLTPPGAQTLIKGIVLQELKAANLLFEHERVLELAFDYLARYPGDSEVLETVGSLLASRSFGLLEQAERWFARAPQSTLAQLKRVEVLIALDKFEDARSVLESGRAGSGPNVNLLLARTALAQGDYATANDKAAAYTEGEFAAQGNLILGGIAYAQGDADKATGHFLAAVQADPTLSNAYSDLGLALLAQGKVADAEKCFLRAEELDFENTVKPGLGRVYAKFAAADAELAKAVAARLAAGARKNKDEFEKLEEEANAAAKVAISEAGEMLSGSNGLEENNPRDLLIRYFAGYALERSGALPPAGAKYRSVIDNDHRYRIAIARLGVVQARYVVQQILGGAAPDQADLAEPGKAADAHLTKAQRLNPNEPVLPYILARFHMVRGTQAAKADKMFALAAGLPAPTGDRDLPNWAGAGQAALAYRDVNLAESKIKGQFNNVIGEIRQMVSREGVSSIDIALKSNPVFRYCEQALAEITENQKKRIVGWTFSSTMPKSWKKNARDPMIINPKPKGIHWVGEMDYGGRTPDPLAANSLEFLDKTIRQTSFYRITYEGVVPEEMRVMIGMGMVKKRRSRGAAGVQVRRSTRGTMEVRIDGARNVPVLKDNRSLDWRELPDVAWPTGPFELRISVQNRKIGTFKLELKTGDGPWINALLTQFPDSEKLVANGETCRLFTRGGGGGGAIQVYIWVEGSEGTTYKDIYLKKVTLVKGVRN